MCGQRPAKMWLNQLRIGDIVRDFAQTIQVVGKRKQARGHARHKGLEALRTMLVRTTSPKVPICGKPDGPYPVSNST